MNLPANGDQMALEGLESHLQANNDQMALEDLEWLIERILDCTRSPESRNFYRKAIATLGKGLVEEELGELKDRVRTGRVKNTAKYFTTLLKTRMEELTAMPGSGNQSETKSSAQTTYFSPTLPALFEEIKDVEFKKDNGVTESFMEIGYAKNRVPWATLIGPEFFTLSTNKNKFDYVPVKIRTLDGEYKATLLRGKKFPEHEKASGILTATQARILGALNTIWNDQQGRRLHDKEGIVVCHCEFPLRQLAELLGWKKFGGHNLIQIKNFLNI